MGSCHGSAEGRHPLRRRFRGGGGGLALLTLALTACVGSPPARAEDTTAALMRLLETRSCRTCALQEADLVHADLRDADLRGAALQRANLSQARLDGARLEGADLRFTSLQGASLRGADLRGARLDGADLRRSDLSGARLDPGALERSHWQEAVGVDPGQLTYPDLHNTGVEAARDGRHAEAERWFGEAIRRQPEAAISWMARGISRGEQGRSEQAAADFDHAATLYEQGGEVAQAKELRQAALQLRQPAARPRGGNGLGGQLLGAALGLAQVLAPLAARAFLPVGF